MVVKVAGLKETRKAVRLTGDPKAIDAQFRGAGRRLAQVVSLRAQAEASLTGRREVMAAARTIQPGSTINGVSVRAGSTGAQSWSLAALFGTHHNQQQHRTTGTYLGLNQFVPVQRDRGPLYRAINKHENDVAEAYLDAIDDLFGD